MKQILAVFLLIFPAISFCAQKSLKPRVSNFRESGYFGVVLGAPTGLTVNFQPEQLSRVFFDLGLWSGDMALDAGWSKSFPGLIEPKDKNFKFQSWLGVAAGARFGKKDSFAVGPVMAQEFRHERSPFIYFLRLIPMVRLSPSVGYELNAVIGAAFSF